MKQWEQWLVGAILLSSAPAFAVVNGTDVDWSKQDNVIRLEAESNEKQYCSGTIIAGKYVLTAAHCLKSSIDKVVGVSFNTSIVKSDRHPSYVEGEYGYDIAILNLKEQVPNTHTFYFANLNRNIFNEDENIEIIGFGGNAKPSIASMALIERHLNPIDRIDAKQINLSHTTGGDSGGAWINSVKEIIATHSGAYFDVNSERLTYATNLHYAKDFLLETIDGWHYPTVVKTQNGKATVKIQSLHVNGIAPNASVTGDVMLTGGTCETTGVLTAFQTCTYEIETANDNVKGQLVLSEQEMIDVNPASESGGSGESSGGSGSSGGSLGWLGLLALFGLGARREIWR